MTKFHIHKDSEKFQPEISYVLKLWSSNNGSVINISSNPDDAITIGREAQLNVFSATKFLAPSEVPFFGDKCLIEDETGRPDYLATAFYMINSMQEYQDLDRDELNRFKFTNSYQHKFQNSKENIVQHCFDEISKTIGFSSPKVKTRFFLTHDIDMVHGAILEDGFNVIKKGRMDHFLKMLFHVAIAKPDWLNMDKIMKIESAYDCKSVFFWIVNKGKISQRERNADYSFHSTKIKKQFNNVEQNGFENGIHKSISSETFAQEFEKFGKQPFSNRYHYLKCNLPQAYHDIEESGLRLDATLGFAEEIGFRNSYGLPFNPYNFKTRKPFSFVEVPLHVMDRTYFQYKKYSIAEAEKDIFNFFESNKENCVISILWHNNFFTNYKFKGYLSLYKKILSYIKDNNLSTITQEEIVKKYSIA